MYVLPYQFRNFHRIFIILNVITIFTVINLSGQVTGDCGILSPHTASSTEGAAIMYDRFGNTYDRDHVSGPSSSYIDRDAGNFTLRIYGDISSGQLGGIKRPFIYLSELISRRENSPFCTDENYTTDPIRIEVFVLSNGTSLAAASGMYEPTNGSCEEVLSNRVYRKINGGMALGHGSFDGRMEINFDPEIQWFYDNNPYAMISPDEIDLESVVLHQAMHLLGMESFIFNDDITHSFISRWDEFLYSVDSFDPQFPPQNPSQILVNECGINCWSLNTHTQQQLEAVAVDNCSDNGSTDLVFGENAIAPLSGNFGIVPNTDIDRRQMLSHLNATCNGQNEDYINQFKDINPGITRAILTDAEKDILCKMGYKLETCDGCAVVGNFETFKQIENPYVDCCFKDYLACTEEPLIIPFDELLCNDMIAHEGMTITNVFVSPEAGTVSLSANEVNFSASGTVDHPRIYYTITYDEMGCACFMDDTYIEVTVGSCEPCFDLCTNLSCFYDFEDLEEDCGLDINVPNGPFYYADSGQNSPDVCADASGNQYMHIGASDQSRNGSGEALLIELQAPIDPGCTMDISLNISAGAPSMMLNIFGSMDRPCYPHEALINFGCDDAPTDCGDFVYNPVCIVDKEIVPTVINYTNYCISCPPSPQMTSMPITWINTTSEPIQYLVIAPSYTDLNGYAAYIYIDDLIVTRSCNAPDPGFTYSKMECSVEFDPIYDGTDYTHHWNFGDGFTSDDIAPTHSYTSNGTYTVTHTITDECGETYPATLVIDIVDCVGHVCACEDGYNIGENGVTTRLSEVNLPTTLHFDECFSFAGSIIVDQPLILFGSNITMREGSSLTIKSGHGMTIFESQISGCEAMWGEILIESGGRFLSRSSQISDGVEAIIAEGGSELVCINTVFDRNNISVSAYGNVNFSGFGFFDNTISRSSPMYPPYDQSNPEAGIILQNVPYAKIQSTFFSNLQYGIISNNSTMVVDDCIFNFIRKNGNLNSGGSCIELNRCPSIIIENNRFHNSYFGINAQRSNFEIIGNEFNNHLLDRDEYSHTAVRIHNNTGYNGTIKNNKINAGQIGLAILDCPGSGELNVIENEIQGGSFFAKHGGHPFVISNSSAISPESGIHLENNSILLDEFQEPGLVSNSQHILILKNSFSTYNDDIGARALPILKLISCENSQVRENSYDGLGTRDGVQILESGNILYCCNTFNNTFLYDVSFDLACGDSHLKMSTFDKPHTALLYQMLAYTGPQIHYSNDWAASSGVDAAHLSSDKNFIYGSRYVVNDIPNNISPMDGWFESGDGTKLKCKIPSNCSEYLWNFNGASESDHQVAYGFFNEIPEAEAVSWSENLRLFNKISKNAELFEDSEFSAFMNENEESEIGSLALIVRSFNETYENSSFGQDMMHIKEEIKDILQQLHELDVSIQNSNSSDSIQLEEQRIPLILSLQDLGNLAESLGDLANTLETNSIEVLKSELAEITVSSNFGTVYKEVLMIYLDHILANGSLSAGQMDQLQSHASTCYQNYGKGVILARNLLDLITEFTTEWSLFDEECENVEGKANYMVDKNPDVDLILHPNPAHDLVQIEWRNEGDGTKEINVYGMNGELLRSKTTDLTKFVMDIDDLVNGHYVVEIISDTDRYIKKLVVLRN